MTDQVFELLRTGSLATSGYLYPGGFNPIDDPDLKAWWDWANIADLTLSGSDITAVADRSGNGYNLSSAAGKYPESVPGVINGRAVGRFDGVDEYMEASWPSFNPSIVGMTVYIVGVKRRADGALNFLVDGLDGTHRHVLTHNAADTMGAFRGGTQKNTSSQRMEEDVPFVATYRLKDNDQVAVIVNLVYELLAAGTGTHWNNGLTICAAHDLSVPGENDIGEIIVVNDDTWAELHISYINYFLARWGIDGSGGT